MLDDVYRFGHFSISPGDRRLFAGTKNVLLAPKVFDLLLLLVTNHGRLVSRDEIVRAVWPQVHVGEANLTNIIVQLRKLLGRDAIETVSKYGYRFTPAVTGEPGVKQTTYATFVRARELLNHRSLESIVSARDLLWLCLAEDPHFALAWAWLGRACRLLEKFNGQPASERSLAEAAFHRAFAMDPDLACAHQFYTQLQIDSGQSVAALTRLAGRLRQRGEEPETLAGLVQVLRVCGLPEASLAAHDRARALDPTVNTSVAHTHFLLGNYARVFETYPGDGYYLDAAAWVGLGNRERALTCLRGRVGRPGLGPIMYAMMASLLAVLEQRAEDALAVVANVPAFQEPEARFYLARHCGMLSAPGPAVEMIRLARLEGFHSAIALEKDPAFAGVRAEPAFISEMAEARDLERRAAQVFQTELGMRLVCA